MPKVVNLISIRQAAVLLGVNHRSLLRAIERSSIEPLRAGRTLLLTLREAREAAELIRDRPGNPNFTASPRRKEQEESTPGVIDP